MTVILENKETLEDRFKIIKHLISIGYVPAVGGGYLATSSWMLSFDVMWELPCRWRALFIECVLWWPARKRFFVVAAPSTWNLPGKQEVGIKPTAWSQGQQTSCLWLSAEPSVPQPDISWLTDLQTQKIDPCDCEPCRRGCWFPARMSQALSLQKAKLQLLVSAWSPESLLPGWIWPLCPHTGWINSQLSLWKKTDQSIGGSYNHQIEWGHNRRQFI